jgi:hypothetical protein
VRIPAPSLLVAALLLCGCDETVGGQAVPLPRADPRAHLPFPSRFLERTNERNDGSIFEPCIAYSARELRALGIDPGSIEDAAVSRGPNYRGCGWRMPASLVSQTVLNQGGLKEYLARDRAIEWQLTRSPELRTLASGSRRVGHCMAVFKSQGAIVVTSVTAWREGKWPGTACDWVVKFASLAASKAP